MTILVQSICKIKHLTFVKIYKNGVTDKFRLDYKLIGDSLIEFDKMDDQGSFVKLHTDQEKSFIEFKQTRFKRQNNLIEKSGFIRTLWPGQYQQRIVIYFHRRQVLGNKTFREAAAIGDSIVKPAFADNNSGPGFDQLFPESAQNGLNWVSKPLHEKTLPDLPSGRL